MISHRKVTLSNTVNAFVHDSAHLLSSLSLCRHQAAFNVPL